MASSKNPKVKNPKSNKKSLPEDIQWCLPNLRDLTTRKFYDAFGHEYNSVQKNLRKYKNIINNELKDVKSIVNIRNEHNIWMKSKENTKYWLEKIRKETVSATHIESARYVQDVVRTEINQINTMENSQNKETDSQSGEAVEETTDDQN